MSGVNLFSFAISVHPPTDPTALASACVWVSGGVCMSTGEINTKQTFMSMQSAILWSEHFSWLQ